MKLVLIANLEFAKKKTQIMASKYNSRGTGLKENYESI